MPWKENRTVDLRAQLIEDHNEGHSIAALAEIYNVSRKTVYKWLERHEEGGVAGLADRRRAPQHSAKLSEEIVAHILDAPAARLLHYRIKQQLSGKLLNLEGSEIA